MADRGSYGLGPRLDIQQLFREAQHRWLRPAEICEILRNYQKFLISSEPPNRPPSGSLFLFDRKVLRYFRKDGHNWRKKKDGKTVKEAHEKLKVGSVDVLHCYYAHGEDNESFQRRSYWMLEQDQHIVFVHYLEVKGNRTNNSPSNSLIASASKEPSGNTDSTSPTSTLTSYCEDADSADSRQANSGHHLHLQLQQAKSSAVMGNAGALSPQLLHTSPGPSSYVHGDTPGTNGSSITEAQSLASWEEVLEQCTRGEKSEASYLSTTSVQSDTTGIGRNAFLSEFFGDGSAPKDEYGSSLQMESHWQNPSKNSALRFPGSSMNQTVEPDLAFDLDSRLSDQRTCNMDFPTTFGEFFSGPIQNNEEFVHNNNQALHAQAEHLRMLTKPVNDLSMEESNKYAFILKPPLIHGEEALKKVDSFSRWVTKELGDVDDLNVKSSSGISWTSLECGNVADDASLSPSLSQDQLFSIIDFSPKSAYAHSETEVHIIGTFLSSQSELVSKWSCMFGELEVPAEVLADGILCCYAPSHDVGRVPFYVTCSNRLACSEVREFEYQIDCPDESHVSEFYGGDTDEIYLHLRLESLLSLRSSNPSSCLSDDAKEKHKLVKQLISLKEDDEGCQVAEITSEAHVNIHEGRWKSLQKDMKEKLYSWLLHTVSGSGKGPTMLDEYGQGVLHLAAGLGYDWAIKPTLTAGVSINFRDANGWTALHWAAYYGREQTVPTLVSLGADTRALTDPSPDCPLGRTPADIASDNGHKGISGFLAESSLTSYLHLLTLNDSEEVASSEVSGITAVQAISERLATPVKDGDVPDMVLMKDSLSAIRNATQAATRIQQVFRMQSFQRKQLTEYDDDASSMLNERDLALLASKSRKPMHSDGVVNAAAVQIQKKYRGWKKRKEFLLIRQRIVKIQAHVRGHQVRKQYRTIIWSVGILEKVILRWRRKGSGLRGLRRDALPAPVQREDSREDDYDFLKEGRKQNEVRQEKALTRVKSMYHCPEGQAQYRRLLTYFEKLKDTKEGSDMVISSPSEMVYGETELIDIDLLLDDDTFMSIAFE